MRRRTEELVSSVEDIVNNLVIFDQELAKERDTEGPYHKLVKRGRVFISYKVGAKWRFAPSRYIGYKDNSMKRHDRNRGDGGETSDRITIILDHDPEFDDRKSEQLQKFANRYDISMVKNLHRFWKLSLRKLETDHDSGSEDPHPEELPASASLWEGATTTIRVNRFERNSKLRERCVQELGYKCKVCGFDFLATYGKIGQGFIHVHHLKPLGSTRGAHEVNPVEDLVPVCPNCHAMLHRGEKPNTPLKIEELKKLMMNATKRR